MSDAVVIELIRVIPAVMAAVTGLAALIATMKGNKMVRGVREDVVVVKHDVNEVAKVTDGVKQDIVEVKKATDGMKDALVAAARVEGRAEGHAEGVSDVVTGRIPTGFTNPPPFREPVSDPRAVTVADSKLKPKPR